MTRPAEVPAAVTALARCWNDLDVEALLPWLHPEVRYSIPTTDTVLVGPPEVRAYVDRKLEGIEAVGEEARIDARPGWQETGGDGYWVVILGQGGLDRSAVCRVETDEDGRIREIAVSADAVDRETATEVASDPPEPVDPSPEAR
jgi:hypothetical protein